MDARHFDTLTRAVSEAGTRRGLLGLLATLPLLGGLFALLDLDESEARGRRHRRRVKRHKHGKGRHRKHHKSCQADAKAKTCAGICGSVINNCKKSVDCTCPNGETCLDGACRNLAGTCTAGQSACSIQQQIFCNGQNYCSCDVAIDGATVCHDFIHCGVCTSNDDCGPGRVCLDCPGCLGFETGCAALC